MTQTDQQYDLHALKNIASQVRRDIVRMVHSCQSGLVAHLAAPTWWFRYTSN